MKNNTKLFKLNYFAFVVIVAVALGACENDLEVFNAGNGLNFYYTNESDTLLHYSFVYGSSTATEDTVWLDIETIGPLSNQDQQITLEQVQTGTDDAVAGTHYVAFDSNSLQSYYMAPANKSKVSVPVILLRDASLKQSSVNLLIRIKYDDYFKLGDPDRRSVQIVFTDKLSKPGNWAIYCNYFFGTYGPVKHQWLIDQTSNKWDDEYLYNVLGFTSSNGINSNYNAEYCSYLSQALSIQLAEYNTIRLGQGLEVLKEEDGTIVSF